MGVEEELIRGLCLVERFNVGLIIFDMIRKLDTNPTRN
jgi:hypothetical protein